MNTPKLRDEIARRTQFGEEAAAEGNRLEAAYQIGYTNALKRWQRELEGSHEKLRWALLRRDGAVYLGYRYRPKKRCPDGSTGSPRRPVEGWHFDRLVGSGPRELHVPVRDQDPRMPFIRAIFLSKEEATMLDDGGGRADAIS